VGGRGEQVGLVALGVDGAADGLAVHRDRDQRRRFGFLSRTAVLFSLFTGPGGGLCEQPGAHRSVHRGGVSAGEHPPQRGLRRGPRGSGVEPGQHLGGHVGDPAGDRGERAHPAQHRGRAQGQHHRDRVITALLTAPIRHRGEPS
jgi:hypothetical protein